MIAVVSVHLNFPLDGSETVLFVRHISNLGGNDL